MKRRKITIHAILANNYETREEEFEGKAHLVVPVIMMQEGVHSGSRGPIFHSIAELGKYEEAWNGIPVTIQHPQSSTGAYISANSPDVLAKYAVGRIFNTQMKDNQLHAEAWLEVEALSNHPEAYQSIQDQEPLDVSVGVFTDDLAEEGEWNGEKYQAIATNYRPDHLALLPGVEGACSWDDGCGIRTNQQNKDMKKEFKTYIQTERIDLTIHEASLTDRIDACYNTIYSMDTETVSYYLREIYMDFLIYEKRVKNSEEPSRMFKHNYSFADGKVTLVGDLVEVERKVEYIPIGTNFLNNKTDMTKTKDSCCPEKVDALIANELSNFTDDDKSWLLEQSAETIEKLIPKVTKAPVAHEDKVVINKENAIEFLTGEFKVIDDYVGIMPQEMQDEIKTGLTLHKEKREALETAILENADVWTKEDLAVMELTMLEKIAKTNPSTTDYSGLEAGGSPVKVNSEEMLVPDDVK